MEAQLADPEETGVIGEKHPMNEGSAGVFANGSNNENGNSAAMLEDSPD